MPKPVSKSVPFSSVKRRTALLVLLTLITGGIAYTPPTNWLIQKANSAFGLHIPEIQKGFILGLDLQGGTRLEYEADMANIPEAERASQLAGVRDLIERRVNALGVSEPLVQTARANESYRVSVELAGIRDVNEAIKTIGETPILEFKEQNDATPREMTAEEKKKLEEANIAEKKKADDILAEAIKNPANVETLAKEKSDDPASKALGGDLGFLKDKPQYSVIFDAIKGVSAGSILSKLIEDKTYYAIAKVEETKDAGQEIKGSHILIQYAGATGVPTSTTRTKEEAKAEIEKIAKEANPKNFTELAKKYSEEPGAKETGGDLGWFGKGIMVEEFEKAAFNLKKDEISGIIETPFGYHIIWKNDERPLTDSRVRAIFIRKTQDTDILPPVDEWKLTGLGGKQLKRATLDFDQRTGAPQIALQFDDEGTKLFAEITKRNLQKPVAIFLDGNPVVTPVVQTEILNGQAVITGQYSVQEAKANAMRLQQGALPVPIKLIAQQTVGPTLGQDSVDKSVQAGLYGFLFIIAFMLFWYRLPGLVALLSLVVYTAMSFAIFKTLPVTLTLSGIAGFILSLGIAVDANVLVYERLKEELRAGKTYSQALEDAFRRAWTSIRDGNATTLISCAVLYWFSSSVIKGFALTLAIGIFVSLFTAIIVTRTFLRLLAGWNVPAKLPWLFLDGKRESK